MITQRHGKTRFSDGAPLVACSDNVLISRLGKVAREIRKEDKYYHDSIDHGLVLLKLLNEAGFEVTEEQ